MAFFLLLRTECLPVWLGSPWEIGFLIEPGRNLLKLLEGIILLFD